MSDIENYRHYPYNSDRPGHLSLRVAWLPRSRPQTQLLVTGHYNHQAQFYGPWEATCDCHDRYGPLVLVGSALAAWWVAGPAGLRVWSEEQHQCNHLQPSDRTESHPDPRGH